MFSLNFTLLRKTKSARYRPAVQALEGRYLLSTFQEFSLPALQRNPLDEFHRERITTGPDGNLWFTDGFLAVPLWDASLRTAVLRNSLSSRTPKHNSTTSRPARTATSGCWRFGHPPVQTMTNSSPYR